MERNKSERFKVCGIPIDCLTRDEAVEAIVNNIQSKRKMIVFTPNVDHIVKAHYDREFKSMYDESDLSLVDGMPLVWVSSLYGRRLPERINGTNLVLRLCEESVKKGFSLFLLGINDFVLRLAVENMQHKYPGLRIAGHDSIFQEDFFSQEKVSQTILKINDCKPDILLVSFGAPQQEKWIYKYYRLLDTSVFIGVGSAFDFISGRLRRAPEWMQNLGLEWLHRLSQEPRRLWRRYLLGNTIFLSLILKEITKLQLRRR